MNDILIKNIFEIFLYEDWANQRLIDNINKVLDEDYEKIMSIPFRSIHGLLHHLYHYQEKYFKKIVDHSISRFDGIQVSRQILSKNILKYSKKWLKWAKKLDNHFMGGEIIFNDIIYLFAHNNYHRGQLQIALAFLGYQPESIDIFLYKDLKNSPIQLKKEENQEFQQKQESIRLLECITPHKDVLNKQK